MPGLVPGIHVFLPNRANKAWMREAFLFGDPALAHSSFTIPH
jgi:hypothetical protein